MDPRADPPGNDEAERDRQRRLLRQLESASRSPFRPGQGARALRAISIALALLGVAAWWFVSEEQKRLAEQTSVPPPAAATSDTPKPQASPTADAAKAEGAGAEPQRAGSFDRDRGRPLDRARPDGR